MKRRFTLDNNIFRITKSFSYDMAFEAFCKGHIDTEELIGKTVKITELNREYTIVEASNKKMVLDMFGKYVERTYITIIDADQDRQLYYYWQRDFQGFDASQIWNLDISIMKYLIPRLEYFSKYGGGQGWPELKNGEIVYTKGRIYLDEMIKGFKLYQEDRFDYTKQESQSIHKAFNLFVKHFGNLWT